MKPRKTLLSMTIVAAFGAAASGALAHGPGWGAGAAGSGACPAQASGARHGGGMRGGMQPEAVAARLAEVKAAVAPRPDQAAAWDAYAARVQAQAEARSKLHEGMQALCGDHEAMADYRVTMMKHNATAAEEINALRKELTAVLTPEQRAAFDRAGIGPGGGAGPGAGSGGRGSGCRAA